jgi:transposase
MAPISKKSMISLLEAWEDQKDQYDTMASFVEAYYKENKPAKKAKGPAETEESRVSTIKEDGEVEQTPRIKVNLLLPSEKKKEKKTRRQKIITEIGGDEKKKREPSKYQVFLKKWREENPAVKGKAAIVEGAAAWQLYKSNSS